VPHAMFVCLDGNYPLPFASADFATVLSCDALQYVVSKKALADEFLRCIRKDGVILIPHVHNKRASVAHGQPFTALGYRTLFGHIESRVIPERVLVHAYFGNDVLDLTEPWPEAELAITSDGVSIVASGGDAIFERRVALLDKYASNIQHPIINP